MLSVFTLSVIILNAFSNAWHLQTKEMITRLQSFIAQASKITTVADTIKTKVKSVVICESEVDYETAGAKTKSDVLTRRLKEF